jgi:hypothetical protein
MSTIDNTMQAFRGQRHSYKLRKRGPKRTDADLMRVYDGIRDYDVLCYIALLAQTMPSHPYKLRPRRHRAEANRAG